MEMSHIPLSLCSLRSLRLTSTVFVRFSLSSVPQVRRLGYPRCEIRSAR